MLFFSPYKKGQFNDIVNSMFRIMVSSSKTYPLKYHDPCLLYCNGARSVEASSSTYNNRELGKNIEKQEKDYILEGQKGIRSEKTLMPQ